MSVAKLEDNSDAELVDVRQAAALVGRNPETVRRWIWSGKLSAVRKGKRLFVAREELGGVASTGKASLELSEWARRAQAARQTPGRAPGRSAADLVFEDRAERT